MPEKLSICFKDANVADYPKIVWVYGNKSGIKISLWK